MTSGSAYQAEVWSIWIPMSGPVHCPTVRSSDFWAKEPSTRFTEGSLPTQQTALGTLSTKNTLLSAVTRLQCRIEHLSFWGMLIATSYSPSPYPRADSQDRFD